MNSFAHRRVSGNFIPGVPISDSCFVGVVSLDELIQYGLSRPSAIEDAKAKELRRDPALAQAHELREAVQRRFDRPRRRRAVTYAGYIDGLASGNLLGGVPPITLYCSQPGFIDDGGLKLPLNSILIAIDGETQTEARLQRRDHDRATGEESLAVMIYHGISAEHAGSIMHDFNRYAHPVSESGVAPLNANGSITKAANQAIADAGIDQNLIQRHGNKVNKDRVTSFSRLAAGAVGFVVPDEVMKGGATRAINRYNNGGNAISAAAAQPFLVHALTIAKADRECAISGMHVWALAGVCSARRNHLITLADWQNAAATFKLGGPDRSERTARALGVG